MKALLSLLIAILPQSEAEAIHLNELSEQLGLAPPAAKAAVREARRAGYPIMSNRKGYWLSNSRNEIASFIKRQTKHVKARFLTIRELRKRLNDTEGQLFLEGDPFE